jgi:hypothetical protein
MCTSPLPPPPHLHAARFVTPLSFALPCDHCACQLIVNNFATILAVFKTYSTHGTISDVFNMQWNDFTDMAQDMQVW